MACGVPPIMPENDRESFDSGVCKELQVSKQRQKDAANQVESDDDLLNEIFKHLDARSLAVAGCVSTRWRGAAERETLWEALCLRHWQTAATRAGQLRSVVTALGGFKRLYMLCLRPLLCRPDGNPFRPPEFRVSPTRDSKQITPGCCKDEVHLSLSLISIDCYERLSGYSLLSSASKYKLEPSAHFSKSASPTQYAAHRVLKIT
ncbi:hypothetical protein O6H91_05G027900 [Diphasiastrum complanatum]|uniref:Uncharacterized protein n=1 Tax=Diphasiastrum complanatum TaxID=34168 RepID=A0ACC2DLT4_DIPCM|nr:hypothetical protein O6H91_05G027900 [Diphasiastrum complanatum]